MISRSLINDYQKCLMDNIRKKEEEKQKYKYLLEKLMIYSKKYKEILHQSNK